MKKSLTILDLTFIINQLDFMFDPDNFWPRVPAIENLREYAACFDASEVPAEGFHRALWTAVRAEVNRLLSTYAK